MYKIVLIDDEEYVINGIGNCIESELQNVQVVGEAKNGLSAFNIIKREKPDIVITDVFMPQMDGLDLIEKSLEIVPFSKFIILSGYEDFQYAQKAIRKKVFDYILKPIEKEKIINIIRKAVEKITDEYNKRNDIEKLRNQLEESLPVLRERYLKYILRGLLSLDSVLKDHSYLNINLSRGNFVVSQEIFQLPGQAFCQ